MSVSQSCRLAGFNALAAISGEALTYGSLSPIGIVQRNILKAKDGVSARDGQIDFDLMGMTQIEIVFGQMAQPIVGNTFIDATGFRHRIRFVGATDITWVCYCTPSPK